MTKGLLLSEKGKVLSKQIQWLLPNSELTSIANGTHNSRVGKVVDDVNESVVHLICRYNLVAN